VANLQRLLKLQEQVQDMERESSRAQGALDAALERLKEEFDCNDLGGAEGLLKKLKKKLKTTEADYTKELEAFEAKWGEQLHANTH